jgi:dTDP-glucose pyrophosphorylase
MSQRATASLDDLIIAPEAPMIEAMRVIDRSGLEIALVCGPGRTLQAVVTDGDIRRAILAGRPLDTAIGLVGNRTFTSLPPEAGRPEAIRLMLERSFKSIPVVDAKGTLQDLHTLRTALLGQRTDSWAVVMAGGRGERLGELTTAIPKPMLPLGDRPILQHIVEHLVAHGIRRIFLSVNHYAKMIEDHFGDGSRFFCRIEYLHEDRPLGTGGALALLPETPTAPLLVMNGDLKTSISLSRLLAFHRAGSFSISLAVREHVVQVPFGVVELDGPRVKRLVEKPKLDYRINAGIYALDPAILALIERGRLYPITELIDHCLSGGRTVGAYHMQEAWNDIGLPEEYAKAQRP